MPSVRLGAASLGLVWAVGVGVHGRRWRRPVIKDVSWNVSCFDITDPTITT